ncbi:MAG: aminoglycoside phosphotransferase family protein [Thermosynechococcaceae cyanobacterium]
MTLDSSPRTQTQDPIAAIAEQFSPQGQVDRVQPFGSGNINDTFLVSGVGQDEPRFILQRINTRVFQQPTWVMRNIRIYSEHVHRRLACDPQHPNCRWQVPRVLFTQNGQDHWIDTHGSFWRAISFIDGSKSFDTIQDLAHAQETGSALGTFHRHVSDLPPDQLADTLEGFHIAPLYLKQYETAIAETTTPISPEVNYCQQFVRDRRRLAYVLEEAKVQGKLPMRTMHGDPKINNILLDAVTGQAISMIDLDTVKPGLVHYDVGDCLRSACNPLGEETEQWESVYFDTDLCQAILKGYLQESQDFLTENDYDYFYDAIRLIAFELGLRFLTDYLAGNVYFKVKSPHHNLVRALVQFKLTASIEAQSSTLRSLIQDLQ